jgi:hypothetical protein
MGGMILIFAFVMSLIINVVEKMIRSNNEQVNQVQRSEKNLVTEQSE